MAHFSSKPRRSGDLFGIEYHFTRRGDGVPMHRHPEPTRAEHNIVVLRGSVEVYGPGKIWSQQLRAGEPPFELPDPFGDHEIVALEDNTETVHYCLHGMPPAYTGLTDKQLTIESDVTLTHPLE